MVILKILPTPSTRDELTKEKRNHGTNLIIDKLNGPTHTMLKNKQTIEKSKQTLERYK
jgi:hypothetical protein